MGLYTELFYAIIPTMGLMLLVVFGVHFSTLISEKCSSILSSRMFPPESSSQFATQTAQWDRFHLCVNYEMKLLFFKNERKTKATTQRTLHNMTSYNKLLIAHLNGDNDWNVLTSSGNVFHNLGTERKMETKRCGQRVMTVYVWLNLLIWCWYGMEKLFWQLYSE